MSKATLNPNDKLKNLMTTYLETKNTFEKNQYGELEAKFGTLGIKTITKENFDNVVQQLKGRGFILENESIYYLNVKTGNVRTTINGLKNIQNYCRINNIPSNYPREAYKFTNKNLYIASDGTKSIVNFSDFNFRISYSLETDLPQESEEVVELIKNWVGEKKFYRLINRYSMTHEDFPELVVDLSIVRESRREQQNLKESDIFALNRKYEIEIELKNDKIEDDTTIMALDKSLKKVTKFILSGLQGTNYPVSYPEQTDIANSYQQLIHNKYKETKPIEIPELITRDFIGPSSITLQIDNIAPVNKESNVINIRNNYTVTDKADGDRKLLYISNDGRIYLITTLMEIEFTGAKTPNKDLFNSLIDGEHIKHNKYKQFINMYAAFDVYYIKGVDMRDLHFWSSAPDAITTKFRLPLLKKLVENLRPFSVNGGGLSPINIQNKTFHAQTSEEQTIFDACNTLNNDIKEYVYETDGYIFTPSNLPVGVDDTTPKPNSFKKTWNASFKWKPAEFNTIDFLITTEKTSTGMDFVGNIFNKGIDTKALDQIKQYKTIVLRVGYDKFNHGYVNPCENILNDDYSVIENVDNSKQYRPVRFYPSNPYDLGAGLTNIELRSDKTDSKEMFTESNEVIEDKTIVEFRYDLNREKQWRWIPLRVRHDKTAEFRKGNKQFGNPYHVAQSNWHSIHNPITLEMLITGDKIPNEFGTDDIYYNVKSDKVTYTRPLRDFHNLFVKYKLVTSVSNPGNTLIDYAVGKAGDLSKWGSARLAFVFGLDVSEDNISNKKDGACARYLNYKKKFPTTAPDVLFVRGNSGQNIKDLSALYSEKSQAITKAVFGEGPKEESRLGKGVIKSYGRGANGFNISSIQFAIHYMFESAKTLNNFLTNVAECTELNGYFIGTSYNGKAIFDLLKDKEPGESYIQYSRDKDKLLEITKRYSRKEFSDDTSCIGYAIDVFQESINKTFKEYLVNYDYLKTTLSLYGFEPLPDNEAEDLLGLPTSVGSFSSLFSLMEKQIAAKKADDQNKFGNALKMTKEQKNISFLNNYFIFKKVRTVNIEDIRSGLSQNSPTVELALLKKSLQTQEAVEDVQDESAATKIIEEDDEDDEDDKDDDKETEEPLDKPSIHIKEKDVLSLVKPKSKSSLKLKLVED